MCQGDNSKISGNDDRREVIYNEIYQEYEKKSYINSLVKTLQMQMLDVSGRLKEVFIEIQIWGWRETET